MNYSRMRKWDSTTLISSISPSWIALFSSPFSIHDPEEFLGVFTGSLPPVRIFQTTKVFRPSILPANSSIDIPSQVPSYVVSPSGRLQLSNDNPSSLTPFVGKLIRVRIFSSSKFSLRLSSTSFWFAGVTTFMTFDHGQWRWKKHNLLMGYTAKKGRQFLVLSTEL